MVGTISMSSRIRINREATTGSYRFLDVFTGFESLDAVKMIFDGRTNEVVARLRVNIQGRPGYLRVDDETGDIVISREYLKTGEERYLHLDVVHELVHVRQFMEGKELFDRRYTYVDRPTEIEAYRTCVAEGRRLEMKDEELVEYLKIEWVSEEELGRLLSNVGVTNPVVRKK